jgi:hypothetical protein
MPVIAYTDKLFSRTSQALINYANTIIKDYSAQGFVLTLRQLYYQFVARGLMENSVQSYKRLGSIVNDGRMAGLIDWYAIEDRTRAVEKLPHWDSPSQLIRACAKQYSVDKWQEQTHRPEVWIEKEALAGVIAPVCDELDVPYLSCRGYTSQSEMWLSAQRMRQYQASGQSPVVLYLGDHDPSGLDMTRDVTERLQTFRCKVEVYRLALNSDQIKRLKLPPNPAKCTDSRFKAYNEEHGESSWELDALEPASLVGLIRAVIEKLCDHDTWRTYQDMEDIGRDELERVADEMERKEKS